MHICGECSLRKSPGFLPLSEGELCFVSQARTGAVKVRRGADLFDQRVNQAQALTITKGWAQHYVTGPDGGESICDFLLPGDWAYLDGFRVEAKRPTGVRALTDLELCVHSYAELYRMFESQPGLVKMLVRTMALDRHRIERRQAAVGRSVASKRLGYLFLELQDRSSQLRLGGANWFPLPVRRQHLENALDLSRAQLSRALSSLRAGGLASFERGMVKIKDRPGLEHHSNYVPMRDCRRLLL